MEPALPRLVKDPDWRRICTPNYPQAVPHLRSTPAMLTTTVYLKYDYHYQGQ